LILRLEALDTSGCGIMKSSTSQTSRVTFFLIALGLFTLTVLMLAAYRGIISSQINQDAIIAGRMRSYALFIYIAEKEPVTLTDRKGFWLTTMSQDIRILLAKYPDSSDDLIMVWRQFYADAQAQRLSINSTQNMVQVADHFLDEINSYARSESRNGYVMLIYGALGLLLLLTRGFILVRELHRAESNLRNSERRFAILAEASIDGIAISENGIIEDANTQFCQLLGYELSEVIGHHLTEFADEQDVERSSEIIRNNREVSYEVTCVRKDKSTFPVEITARTLQFPQRTMRLTVARDITAQKQLEKEWQEANNSLAISNQRWRALATLDSLTGAYTRRALHLTMIREIRRASYSGLPFSVMLLDVDNFKQYNDSFGHVAGDEVLRRVVEVLRTALRDVDVVARYGGDEFIIILVDTGPLEANVVARRCYQAIGNETDFKRVMTASIGVLTCFIETDAPVEKEFCIGLVERILLCADKALYQSKRKTGEHIHIADNLRVNKDFVAAKSSHYPSAIKPVEDDIVDDLLSDLLV
jgi:diguanylate cyclase (GGDEF)-like protein/PAS domain S-box-containing protein